MQLVACRRDRAVVSENSCFMSVLHLALGALVALGTLKPFFSLLDRGVVPLNL
jgi:hypothetical protein